MPDSAGLLGWLEATSLAAAMRGSVWMYPIVEIVHIVGFAILVGSIAMFDLRVLGFAGSLPVKAVGRHLLPWAVASLGLIVPAGLLMFSAHPLELASSAVFQLKLALIGAAGVNAAIFHAGAYRGVLSWNEGRPAPLAAKAHAAASLLLWIAVISCGRLLAYT